ncbi:tetratricopeptide repeat protein [Undibacterium jejuense]|uniref:Tetratricopeptide repeat protein n=1 Tax=Undibacterium jejuense TaxID=1344949 RepID=A0A923HGI8_9BURK|nr:tetratricopeptide repeat protein [Undibacterium jejuense]MBC3861212.1 tetratricopeptide repeat protein [Undibacterium jejuense]
MKTISASVTTSIVSALRPAAYLTCAALLSACASLGGKTTSTGTDTNHAHEAAQAALAADKDLNGAAPPVIENKEKLPNAVLTDELFYKILTAEIAYQRGSWQAAYVTLLTTAQQTRDPRLARRSAEIALSAKQAGEALVAIRLWRELAPDSNEATQYYLGFMVMNNNLSEIKQVFTEKLANADSKQYGVIMLQAQRLLSRARDKNAAFDVLEEILAPYKALPEAHLALAQGAYNKGDGQRAIIEAKIMLAAHPESQLAILTIAQASAQPDAAQALAGFIAKNPGARDIRLAYASILIDLKQFDKAQEQFQLLLRDTPDDLNSMYTLGVLALGKNQLQQAEEYFLRYLKTLEEKSEDRDATSTYMNLAGIAIDRKDYKSAQEWLAKIESYEGRNPAWFNAQLRRASLLIKLSNTDEALSLLHELKPTAENDQLQVIQTEAQILRDTRQTDRAEQVFKAGLAAHPNSPDLMYDYAMLLESQDRVLQMETLLRKVIELAPNSQHAYNALGYSFADRNIKLEEALVLIEKANQLAPDDPFILDSLGWVKFRLAKYDEAETALRRAYELRPDADIAVHLGEVLWRAGNKDKAVKLWREARTKDPENSSLKSTLDRLNVHL